MRRDELLGNWRNEIWHSKQVRVLQDTPRAFNFAQLITVARINLLMLVDKLRSRCVVILDLEETMLLPFLSPVIGALRCSTSPRKPIFPGRGACRV
jgi:hypothetical protein